MMQALGGRALGAPGTAQRGDLQYRDGALESPGHAATSIADWISKAECSISISTGLTSGLISQPPIRKALTDADGRGVKIKILLDYPSELSEYHGWLLGLKNGEVRRAPMRVDHWIIIDNNKMRMERSHALRSEGGSHAIRSCFWIIGGDERVFIRQQRSYDGVWEIAEVMTNTIKPSTSTEPSNHTA